MKVSLIVLYGVANLQLGIAGILGGRSDSRNTIRIHERDDTTGFSKFRYGEPKKWGQNSFAAIETQLKYLEAVAGEANIVEKSVGPDCLWRRRFSNEYDVIYAPGFSAGPKSPKYAALQKNFESGSACVFHDIKIALIIRIAAGRAVKAGIFGGPGLERITQRANNDFKPGDTDCLETGTNFGGGQLCVESEPLLASMAEGREAINKVTNKLSQMSTMLDAWTCRDRITDKSLTYHVLFHKQESEYNTTVAKIDDFTIQLANLPKNWNPSLHVQRG
ncbi:hypothetical protein TWF694_002715 [Orbilia ellipsospora]|uniref:Uncharacterized protein n=1 Tax=Orbilia ellipsospora TaxID=2528407 RepID=A0AAV9X2T6_9PEZI